MGKPIWKQKQIEKGYVKTNVCTVWVILLSLVLPLRRYNRKMINPSGDMDTILLTGFRGVWINGLSPSASPQGDRPFFQTPESLELNSSPVALLIIYYLHTL